MIKDFFLSQSYHDFMLKSVRLLGQKNDITLFMDCESPMTPGLHLLNLTISASKYGELNHKI